MNQREAKMLALKAAWTWLDSAQQGPWLGEFCDGLPEKDQERIFKEFEKITQRMSERYFDAQKRLMRP